VAEQTELTEAMRAAAVSLGDRFRLRLQLNGVHRMHTASIADILVGTSETTETRRAMHDKDAKSDSLSADTIALLVTALVGLGSFYAQAKATRDTNAT
jgi:hypothetical protein